jgi:hypothetical protein
MGPIKKHADLWARVRHAYGDAGANCQENGRSGRTPIWGRYDIVLIARRGDRQPYQKLASGVRSTQGIAVAPTVGGSRDSLARATFVNAAS